jgi:hypothetical protein
MARQLAVLLAVGTVAAAFAAAAVGKARDRAGTVLAAEAFGVPRGLTGAVARLLPPMELAVAAGVVVPATRRVAGLGALVLLLGFTAAVLGALRHGRRPACHCFGSRSDRPVGTDTVARNVALAALAVVAVLA